MAFALLSRSRSKTQGSVKPAPKQKSARVQRPADSRPGFAKPVIQPPTTALPAAPVIQTKLKIGEPNDEFEQEADRMAEQEENGNSLISPSGAAQSRSPMGNFQRLYGNRPVLQMRHGIGDPLAPAAPLRLGQSGILQRKCACGGAAGMSGECEECSKKKRLGLQTKLRVNEPGDIYEVAQQSGVDRIQFERSHQQRGSSSSEEAPRMHQIARNGVRGAGTPVPFQNEIQPLMPGLDLSTVRAHEGSATDAALDALGANAYATGSDLGLPANASRHLVAHELAHVAQQREGVRLNDDIGEEGDAYEVAANAIADRVASGRSAAELMPATAAPQAIGPIQLDIRAPRSQAELNEDAVWLGEQQAKRRNFFDFLNDVPDWMLNLLLQNEDFRNKLVELDINYDPPLRPVFGARRSSRGTFRRAYYVDAQERDVENNYEARSIYNKAVWGGTVNKPSAKSRFDAVIGFLCRHTSPCKENMEQFREDVESGMSPEEARRRGFFRILEWGLEAISQIPSGGPRGGGGPVVGTPQGPFKVPAPATGGKGTPIGIARRQTPPTATPTNPIWEPPPAPPKVAPTQEPIPKPTIPSPTAKPAPPPPKVTPTQELIPKPTTPTEEPTTPIPQPRPQVPETQQRRRKCPFPTGRTVDDPIPIQWFKPRLDRFYPKTVEVRYLGHSYFFDRDAGETRLPRGEPFGVSESRWPARDKKVRLKYWTGRRAESDRYRGILTRYGYSRSGLQIDHVQDPQWGLLNSDLIGDELDVWSNLWPLSQDLNASAGGRQNNNQLVTFCEEPYGQPRQNISVAQLKAENRYGLYFVIQRIDFVSP